MSTKKKVSPIAPAAYVDPLPAGIQYINLPNDHVMIMGFSGILTEAEIENKHGKKICSAYKVYDECVFKSFDANGKEIVRVIATPTLRAYTTLYAGKVMSDKDFSVVVQAIRKAGRILNGIVNSLTNFNPLKTAKM